MEVRSYNVYKFEELPLEGQKKAIDRYRDINTDYEWWEFVYETEKNHMEEMGIKIIEINFSGFWSQGDGASFTGIVSDYLLFLEKIGIKTNKKIKKEIEECPLDIEFERDTHHYYHENTCSVCINTYHNEKLEKFFDKVEEKIEKWRIEKCREIYRNLKSEYKYLTSGEAIKETLICNDYDFTIDGEID